MLITKPSSTILDIGTGFMINLEILLRVSPSSSRIYSIDPSLEVVEEASRRFRDEVIKGRVVLSQARAEEIPLPDESLDYVTSAITFHHVEDKDAALKEISRLLRKDGLAIVLDWGRRGAEYSPHTPEHLDRSLLQLRQKIMENFKIRLEKNFNDVFYLVVFSR